MIAFARSQTSSVSDAEDLVQEAFIGFLRSIDRVQDDGVFGERTRIEACLFRILRRRIIDLYRSRGSSKEVNACGWRRDSGDDPVESFADPQASPSVHLQNEENASELERTLCDALHHVIDQLKAKGNLRDLMILEGVFYAAVSNRELSKLIDVAEGRIAVIRHRLLARMKENVSANFDGQLSSESELGSDLLSEIWERDRPSCPKRTTLGKAQLGILDSPWQQYVSFHVNDIGCNYCKANWEDIADADLSEAHENRSHRIFQSTIGFVKTP